MENTKVVINTIAIACATISVLSVINTIRLNSDFTELYKNKKASEVYLSALDESNSSYLDKIDGWDVSRVAPLYTNIEGWDVSGITSEFSNDIIGWDVSDVISFKHL